MLIRLPARRLVMSGGVLVVLGLLFSSFVPNVYFLYVTNGLMQGNHWNKYQTVNYFILNPNANISINVEY